MGDEFADLRSSRKVRTQCHRAAALARHSALGRRGADQSAGSRSITPHTAFAYLTWPAVPQWSMLPPSAGHACPASGTATTHSASPSWGDEGCQVGPHDASWPVHSCGNTAIKG